MPTKKHPAQFCAGCSLINQRPDFGQCGPAVWVDMDIKHLIPGYAGYCLRSKLANNTIAGANAHPLSRIQHRHKGQTHATRRAVKRFLYIRGQRTVWHTVSLVLPAACEISRHVGHVLSCCNGSTVTIRCAGSNVNGFTSQFTKTKQRQLYHDSVTAQSATKSIVYTGHAGHPVVK